MIIVKRKSEIVRFGLFLLLVGGLIYFVTSRAEDWRLSEGDRAVATGGQGDELVQGLPVEAGEQGLTTADGLDFFADFRIDRQRNRSRLQESLKMVMESAENASETRQRAGEAYLAASREAALEEQAEQMVKAKGFEEVVVNLAGDSAQVVVRAAGLTQPQALQVLDLVHRITGVKESAIQVMARER